MLIGIAVLMTVGVYGLVAGIVKLDDARPVAQPRARVRGAAARWAAASCAPRRG